MITTKFVNDNQTLLNAYQYCVINSNNDVLCLCRFSETAQTTCDKMNESHDEKQFSVAMTLNQFKPV